EPVQLREATRDRVPPRTRRRQLVGELVTLLAKLGYGVAFFRPPPVGAVVCRLCVRDGLMDSFYLFGRGLCLGRRCFGSALGLNPAGMEQARFDAANLLRQLAIAFC